MSLKVNVLTLFPKMFPGALGDSIPGKAMDKQLWDLNIVDIRDFSTDKHSAVDDTPFGGGAGMVMRAEVIDAALQSIENPGEVVYLTPRGDVFNQSKAMEMSHLDAITIICGRYEGIDQRVVEKWNMTEISIGDFVLSGGEPAVQIIIDSIVRLIPGAVGDKNSIIDESFEDGLLEYSHYTRPQQWQGRNVPEVLLSGHHQNIETWRKQERKRITQERRPDLWQAYIETKTDIKQ